MLRGTEATHGVFSGVIGGYEPVIHTHKDSFSLKESVNSVTNR